VSPNTELDDVFSKFDFDTVTARTLAEFPYVLTTRAEYASTAPPAYEPVETTENYTLWKRSGEVGERQPGETNAEPGRLGGCPQERPATVSWFAAPPVVAEWDRGTVEDGEQARAVMRLPAGTWDLSLQYDSTRPLELSGPNLRTILPGNLDFRGPAPFWAAGSIEVERETEVALTAEVERPPLAGRLLGASSVAHLGKLAATTRDRPEPGDRACEGYVDWFEPGR
jgi:hypothetical protein